MTGRSWSTSAASGPSLSHRPGPPWQSTSGTPGPSPVRSTQSSTPSSASISIGSAVGVEVPQHADLRAVVAHLVEHGPDGAVAPLPRMALAVALEHLVGGVAQGDLQCRPAVLEAGD